MVNQTAVNLLEGASPKFAHKTPCQLAENLTQVQEKSPILVCFLKFNKQELNYQIQEGDVILNKKEQAMILSGFYLGGLIAALPSGYLCDKQVFLKEQFQENWGRAENQCGGKLEQSR